MTTAPRQGAIRWGAAFALPALVLDQATKATALASERTLSAGIELLPFMNLVLVRNTGVSFGMFASGNSLGQWPLILLTGAIIIGLSLWLARTGQARLAAPIGAIVGAGLGNVTDRLVRGGVTDFLDFHYAGYHWPAFNLADSMIFIGVLALLLSGASKTQAPIIVRDPS